MINNFSTSGGITNITNNNSGCSSGSSIYYPNMAVTVQGGSSFNISVQAGSAYAQGFGIWIDWNNDGDFADTGEDVWDSGTSGFQAFTGTITPPAIAGGTHRMRVKCEYVAVPTGPCGSVTWGEEEDYHVIVITNISDFPYCEDFEDNDGFWNSGGILPSWEHGQPANSTISDAYSGDNAWVTNLDGDYNNDELSYLETPEIDFTALVDPAIRFWCIRDLESGDDGVQVQVSLDSGNTYSVLGSSSSSNWFNSSSVAALTSNNGNGNGWTGQSSGWESVQHSLSSYASDTSVFLRFLMAADGNTVDEGFGLDHVIIGESDDVSITELFYADSACGEANATIYASICNLSIIDQTGFGIDLDTNGTTISYTYNDTLPLCQCDTIDLVSFNTTQGGTWTLEAEIDNSGDVNAANDTISGTMTHYATPGVSISGGGNFCEGDFTTLTFELQGTGPWNLSFTDSVSPTYIANIASTPYTYTVSTGGVYEALYVTDASGCPADTNTITGQAVVTFFPAPVVDLGPDTDVCGDTVLDAGAGLDTYSWSTSATTQSITVTQSGQYSVTVTDSLGCVGSDDVDLNIFQLPVVDMEDTVLCEGASFIFNAGAPYAGYLWHDGSTGQLFQIDSVGTVSVTVTDFNGCEGTASASITAVVPNPTPTVVSSEGLAPVTLDAGSGYSAYLWNTNATTQTIQASIAGTYTCTVTDQYGCKGSDEGKTKIWPAGVEDIVQANGFATYPNPAKETFTIEFAQNVQVPAFIEVYDLRGARVHTHALSSRASRQQINFGRSLEAGHYVLRFTSDDEAYEAPLIIVN